MEVTIQRVYAYMVYGAYIYCGRVYVSNRGRDRIECPIGH